MEFEWRVITRVIIVKKHLAIGEKRGVRERVVFTVGTTDELDGWKRPKAEKEKCFAF